MHKSKDETTFHYPNAIKWLLPMRGLGGRMYAECLGLSPILGLALFLLRNLRGIRGTLSLTCFAREFAKTSKTQDTLHEGDQIP